MILMAFVAMAFSVLSFSKMLPLTAEKQKTGQLSAEKEALLQSYRRRISVMSGISMLFLAGAVLKGL